MLDDLHGGGYGSFSATASSSALTSGPSAETSGTGTSISSSPTSGLSAGITGITAMCLGSLPIIGKAISLVCESVSSASLWSCWGVGAGLIGWHVSGSLGEICMAVRSIRLEPSAHSVDYSIVFR